MDFLTILISFAANNNISEEVALEKHFHYCQNLYFMPESEVLMERYSCDYGVVETEIARVKSGKY